MKIGNIELLNVDCMKLMAKYPDAYFDLAICDPPYGIGQDWKKRNKGNRYKETTYKNQCIPDKAYFDEVKRVSKNYIFWGWNYYTEVLGPTNYLICWDKQSADNDSFYYSQFELACTSLKVPANMVSIPWDGCRMGKETGKNKIHPHQKPIGLYKWLLKNYAKEEDKILDTHLGSGSIAIACHDYKFELTGCEIDKDYFDAAVKRLQNHVAQTVLF